MQLKLCYWVCMKVFVLFCFFASFPAFPCRLRLKSAVFCIPLDSCSLNTEEWTWIFLNCTHTHRLSVPQRTPATPTLSGETLEHEEFSISATLTGDSTQLRELTQNKAKLSLRTISVFLLSWSWSWSGLVFWSMILSTVILDTDLCVSLTFVLF